MANLNFNKIIIGGRISNALEQKTTQTGKSVTYFSIAINKYIKGEQTTQFINCVAYDKQSEFLNEFFEKGSNILIEGELNLREYTTKDKQKRIATEIIVSHIHFVDTKKERENNKKTNVTEDDYLPF